MEQQTKNLIWALISILGLVAIVLLFKNPTTNDMPVACTMDAMMCPDGSYVGRTGPNCEFEACPVPRTDISAWQTFSDDMVGVSLRYPDTLPTTYIDAVDWPPQAQIVDGPFTCTPGGIEVARAGVTTSETIGGHAYCVTKVSEGAAGSIYTQYAYARAVNDKVAILTFSLRAVQCDNYDEPEQTACTDERASFDINPIADAISQTLTF